MVLHGGAYSLVRHYNVFIGHEYGEGGRFGDPRFHVQPRLEYIAQRHLETISLVLTWGPPTHALPTSCYGGQG